MRSAREARGLTQLELARRAGISRQALGALEAGTYQPGVSVAIALARELGDTVEGLFGGETKDECNRIHTGWVNEDPWTSTGAGGCIALARVGGKIVAVPYPAARLMLASPAGTLEQSGRGRATIATYRSESEIESTLLLAGCDPASAILADWLARHRSPISAVALPCSSSRALAALIEGRAHVAGVHSGRALAALAGDRRHAPGARTPGRAAAASDYDLAAEERGDLRNRSDDDNSDLTHAVLGRRSAFAIRFARWELGLATAPGTGEGIRGIDDLARPGLRLVNREVGAGARAFLDEALVQLGVEAEEIEGYGFETTGHLEVAAAIAAGRADAGVTIRVAAEAHGLPFISLREECYDLVILERDLETAPVKAMLDTLSSRRFALEVSQFCAYDTEQMGQVSGRNG